MRISETIANAAINPKPKKNTRKRWRGSGWALPVNAE